VTRHKASLASAAGQQVPADRWATTAVRPEDAEENAPRWFAEPKRLGDAARLLPRLGREGERPVCVSCRLRGRHERQGSLGAIRGKGREAVVDDHPGPCTARDELRVGRCHRHASRDRRRLTGGFQIRAATDCQNNDDERDEHQAFDSIRIGTDRSLLNSSTWVGANDGLTLGWASVRECPPEDYDLLPASAE